MYHWLTTVPSSGAAPLIGMGSSFPMCILMSGELSTNINNNNNNVGLRNVLYLSGPRNRGGLSPAGSHNATCHNGLMYALPLLLLCSYAGVMILFF